MEFKKKAYKYFSAGLAAALLSTSLMASSAIAVSSDTIRQRLEEQERQAESLQNSLESVKNAIDKNKSKVDSLNEIINNYNGVIEESKEKSKVVDGQLQEVIQSKNSVAEQIAELNQQIQEKIEKINKLEKEIVDLTTKIRKTEKEIKRLEREVEKSTKLLEKRLVVMYKQGDVKQIEVLLASEDINDFLSRQTMMGTITSHDKKLIAKLKADKEALDELRKQLNGEKVALEVANENAKKEQAKLEEDKKVQDLLYEELKVQEGLKAEEIEYLKSVTQEYEGYLTSTLDNKKRLSNEISKRENEIENLEDDLENSLDQLESTRTQLAQAQKAEEEARRKQEELERRRLELQRLKEAEEAQRLQEQAQQSNSNQGGGVYIPSTGGEFAWPAATTYITSYYGWRDWFGYQEFHTGFDLAAPINTPIYASKAGVVTYSGWDTTGYGNLLKVNHMDGTETWYAHLNQSYVTTGQKVEKGQTIAGMGTTGRSTGPHLHFEIRIGGRHVNPLDYLR